MSGRVRCIGYIRVSTQEQADSGLGLDAQRHALVAEAERRGWDLEIIEDAGFTGRNDNRPGLHRARATLKRRQADVLMVYKLDRLSRSMQDFARILNDAQRQRWSLVAVDLGVDTTTPNGRLVASVLMAVAQWESETIGARTKDAMAAAKDRGSKFGRERQTPNETVARIRTLRAGGLSFERIAAALDAEDVPTPTTARRWYGATVSRIYNATTKAA